MDTPNTQPNQEPQTISPKSSKKHKWPKIILIIGVLVALSTYALWFYVVRWPVYQVALNDQREGQERYDAMIQMWKEDIYGGDTPEETYEMFADAVRKKDIDLAMKYVYIPERERVQRFFDEKIKNNELDDYIQNDLLPIEKMGKYEKGDYIYLTYEKYVPLHTIDIEGRQMPAGGFVSSFEIQLAKNTHTNKWKISSP